MRILIISPHFPPTNAADMQRVRLVLPYLLEQGVEAEILCVDPSQIASPQDRWLDEGLPTDALVHRVRGLDRKWGKLPGLGTLTSRAIGALRRRGDELLGGEVESRKLKVEIEGRGSDGMVKGEKLEVKGGEVGDVKGESVSSGSQLSTFGFQLSDRPFDLVYFSTTQFGVHVLGPRWKRKFGVPFVMDYQDPWVSDYYRKHPEVMPPGGRLKYGIANWINRRQEPQVLRHCSGITSVSAAYPEQLVRRYAGEESKKSKVENRNEDKGGVGDESTQFQLSTFNFPLWSTSLPSLVLPFPGDARDFERVKQEGIRQTVFDPADGLKHWVYIGRGGADMALAVRGLFAALAAVKAESGKLIVDRLRLHFIGTSYAAAGTGVKTIEPLAREYDLERQVIEHPDRIPYSETLRCLLDADALIIPGSDDPGYTASKIYPYLLAGKPLLGIFHEQSSVVELVRRVGGGSLVAFQSGDNPQEIARRIAMIPGFPLSDIPLVPLQTEAFLPQTAQSQALQLTRFWRHCLSARTTE